MSALRQYPLVLVLRVLAERHFVLIAAQGIDVAQWVYGTVQY